MLDPTLCITGYFRNVRAGHEELPCTLDMERVVSDLTHSTVADRRRQSMAFAQRQGVRQTATRADLPFDHNPTMAALGAARESSWREQTRHLARGHRFKRYYLWKRAMMNCTSS
jgi:hypothetical protein